MSFLNEWNASACDWVANHLDKVSVAIAASLMVIAGGVVIKIVRDHVGTWHFVLRTLAFVVVSGLGFGFVVALVAPELYRLLGYFGHSYLLLTTVLAFFCVGLLAERRNQI